MCMHEKNEKQRVQSLLIVAGILLIVEVFSWLFLGFSVQERSGLRLGEAAMGPMIDTQAVMVDGEDQVVALCQTLPSSLWMMLLGFYILLLAYNLSSQRQQYGEVRFWRFEMLLSFFFLFEWQVFDTCREALWFPWALMKTGLILTLIFWIWDFLSSKNKN